jgi:hypothetical protein
MALLFSFSLSVKPIVGRGFQLDNPVFTFTKPFNIKAVTFLLNPGLNLPENAAAVEAGNAAPAGAFSITF